MQGHWVQKKAEILGRINLKKSVKRGLRWL